MESLQVLDGLSGFLHLGSELHYTVSNNSVWFLITISRAVRQIPQIFSLVQIENNYFMLVSGFRERKCISNDRYKDLQKNQKIYFSNLFLISERVRSFLLFFILSSTFSMQVFSSVKSSLFGGLLNSSLHLSFWGG